MKSSGDSLVAKVLLAFVSLTLALVVGEIAVRLLGEWNADGNFVLNDRLLRPYRPPVASTRNKVERYLEEADQASLLYHPTLGWVPRPHSVSRNGLYRYDSRGIRSLPREISVPAVAATRRIVTLGDSFTHGDEVAYEESWAFALEQLLRRAAPATEVVNLGVPGYGMDQALLRWRQLGRELQPDVVIFGLQMENVKRNVNLLRPLYSLQSGIPFAKPRFVLRDAELQLLNVPVPEPTTVPQILRSLDTWPLAEHELLYVREAYRPSFWLRSKLLSLSLEIVRPNRPYARLYDLDGEPARLADAIVRQLRQEVETSGAVFVAVHLPTHNDLERRQHGEALPYADLLARIASAVEVVATEAALGQVSRAATITDLFAVKHYSALGNRAIAEALVASSALAP